MTEKVLLSWSGGKDSALSLFEIKNNNNYEIIALLTTITEDYNRISMHGVASSLLEQQEKYLNIPIEKIFIKKNESNEEYENKIKSILTKYQKKGVFSVVFGDVHLEDVRMYRENNLLKIGMKGIFPLWKKNTKKLVNSFIELGFRAIITCVNTDFLNNSFVGRNLNRKFISNLPSNVDPCGENGEYHSFVYDGPIFKNKILFKKGKSVLRENRLYYCDLIPNLKI